MSAVAVERLLHPTKGVLRGLINHDEPKKGGRDPDDKLVNITVGELRQIHAALAWQKGKIDAE